MTNKEIVSAVEDICPLEGQESWDNSGWQVGDPEAECSGVLVCVDVTEDIIGEAKECGCSLVVSHHPLIFHGLKSIAGQSRVEQCVAQCLRDGISVYSAHTSCDCAPEPRGVSYEMARLMGLTDVETLDAASGLGVVGNLDKPLSPEEFFAKVKATFGCEHLRHSRLPEHITGISRVAMTGGAAAEFLPEAIRRGAQAYVTADCKHNYFLDYADRIILVDAGHFETEQCTKSIFLRAISEKFPNFAVYKSLREKNPVIFM